MSRRKTRRGIKIEASDETLQDLDSSKLAETSVASRSLRTRRQLKQKTLDDTDIEQSPCLNETKRVTRANKSAAASEVFGEGSAMNVTLLSGRKRPRKDNNVTAENAPDDSNLMSESISVRNARGRKKKLLQDDDNLGSGSNEDVVASKKGRKKDIATPSNFKFLDLQNREVNSPGSVVTPESSPLVVDLTPHRTTKTPRKSPINLGSPKTHSISPQRHSKTPRKLPIVAPSPVTSDYTSSNGTPPKPQSTTMKTVLLESPLLRSSIRRVSISPKRALRSSKSVSPRVIAKKMRKSPKNTPRVTTKISRARLLQKSQIIESKKIENKTKSPQLVLRRISPTNSSDSGKVTPVLTPSMLEHLKKGGESPKRPKSTAKKRSSVTSSGTPLRPIPSPKQESTKKTIKVLGSSNTPLPTLAAVQAGQLASSTPRERFRRSLNLSSSLETLQKSSDLSSCTVNVEKFYGRTSKTPIDVQNDSKFIAIADETRPLMGDDDTFDISGIKAVDSSRDSDNPMMEKSPPPLQVSLNDTYELDEPKTPGLKKKKSENDTYELEEPKTPGLRRKRNMAQTSLSVTIDTNDIAPKRVCKVRFASPSLKSSASKITMRSTQSRTATPGSKISSTRSSGIQGRARLDGKSPKLTQVVAPRRRSNSLSVRKNSPSASGSKKRSSSVVNTSRSTSKALQNESVNRLSKPRQSILSEKKEAKTLSAKKAPNFAQIHQKKFAKMESLVDAKKRVEERHNLLRTNVTSSALKNSHSSTKVAPAEATNGNFNRFGFKVRKDEASKIANKQPGTKKIESNKVEQRNVLKGVRSNRRFELQMKMRNLAS